MHKLRSNVLRICMKTHCVHGTLSLSYKVLYQIFSVFRYLKVFNYILSELFGHVESLLFHILESPVDLSLLTSQLETSSLKWLQSLCSCSCSFASWAEQPWRTHLHSVTWMYAYMLFAVLWYQVPLWYRNHYWWGLGHQARDNEIPFCFPLLAPLIFLYKILMHLIVQCPTSAQKAPLACPSSSCYIYCNFTFLKIKQRLYAPFGKWEMKADCQCLLNKVCLRWQPWLRGYSCSDF